MEIIEFNNDRNQETISYLDKPVFRIIRINYLTEDKDWASKLRTGNLSVKISAVDNKGQEVAFEQRQLSLGASITAFHKKPVLEINQTYKLSRDFSFYKHPNCESWRVVITLNNMNFNNIESLTIEYMDTLYVKKRVEDWAQRVHDLIEILTIWANGKENIEIRASRKQKMDEGMMKDFGVPMHEIDSADVLKNGQIIMALKPFGLWIIGANGRIDLLTGSKNFVLVDESLKFQEPKWKLYLKDDKKQGVRFTKEVFFQLIEA
jgi:hypothetical protein